MSWCDGQIYQMSKVTGVKDQWTLAKKLKEWECYRHKWNTLSTRRNCWGFGACVFSVILNDMTGYLIIFIFVFFFFKALSFLFFSFWRHHRNILAANFKNLHATYLKLTRNLPGIYPRILPKLTRPYVHKPFPLVHGCTTRSQIHWSNMLFLPP